MKLTLHGKTIGQVEDGWLVKSGKQAVLFRNLNGFGVAKDAFRFFTKGVEIHYEGKIYRATLEDFKQARTYDHLGYEPQKVLPMKYWTIKTNQMSML